MTERAAGAASGQPFEKRLAALTYAERQFVIIEQPQAPKPGTIWAKRAAAAAGLGVAVLGGPIGIAGAAAVTLGAKLYGSSSRDGLKPLLLSRQEALVLTFPPGHPRSGILYVGHPTSLTAYYPASEFHRFVFEHKVCEAINVLVSLGAVTVRAEHLSGWSKDFASRLNIPFTSTAATAGAGAGASSHAQSRLLFTAELSGNGVPTLPKGLAWYAHEPTWQTIAQARLASGLERFSLSVGYQDDYGVNAALQVRSQQAGWDMGGAFEGHQSTNWLIEGMFGPKWTAGEKP